MLGDVLATNKLGTAVELLVDPLAFNNAGMLLCASEGGAANCVQPSIQMNLSMISSTKSASITSSDSLGPASVAAIATVAVLVPVVLVTICTILMVQGKLPIVMTKCILPLMRPWSSRQNRKRAKGSKRRPRALPSGNFKFCEDEAPNPSINGAMESHTPVSQLVFVNSSKIVNQTAVQHPVYGDRASIGGAPFSSFQFLGPGAGAGLESRFLSPRNSASPEPFWSAHKVQWPDTGHSTSNNNLKPEFSVINSSLDSQGNRYLHPQKALLQPQQLEALYLTSHAAAAAAAAAATKTGSRQDTARALLTFVPPSTGQHSPGPSSLVQFRGAPRVISRSSEPPQGTSAAKLYLKKAVHDTAGHVAAGTGRELTPSETRPVNQKTRALTPLETLLSRSPKPRARSLPPAISTVPRGCNGGMQVTLESTVKPTEASMAGFVSGPRFTAAPTAVNRPVRVSAGLN